MCCIVSVIVVFLSYHLLGDEVISNFFKIYWVRGLSWVVLCSICVRSLGEGRCGPINVDLRLSRTSLSEIPDALALSQAILIVLICLLMKPLDLG